MDPTVDPSNHSQNQDREPVRDLSTLPPPPPPPPPPPMNGGPAWGAGPGWGGARPWDARRWAVQTSPPSGPPRPARRTPAWLALGSIVVLAMLVTGSYQVVGVLAHEEQTFSTVVSDTGIRVLDIDNDAGGIEVVGAPVDVITVRTEVSEGLRSTGHSQRVDGDRLVLRANCPNFGSTWCGVTYRVEVPQDLEVVLRSEGSLTVKDLTGPVDARAKNSSVTAERLSGTTTLRSINGSVRAVGLRSEIVEARSTNGSVRLAMVVEPRSVLAVTVNGSAEVVVPRTETSYSVDVDTVNGSRTNEIRTDPTAARRVTARSTNGSATVRYPE